MHLLQASLSTPTKLAYRRSWEYLMKFCLENQVKFHFPVSHVLIANFISHLFNQKYSPSTIASHCSAISFVHKLIGSSDPCQSFLIKKLLKGVRASGTSADSRLPITQSILFKIINALDKTVPQYDLRQLLKALFLLAFHAFLRLGELIAKSKVSYNTVVQRSDVHFDESRSVVFRLKNFKTKQTSSPITIQLTALPEPSFCPVANLKAYLTEFPNQQGPLFQFKSSMPVNYQFVTSHLNTATSFIGLNPKLYKGHSFRIGAATEAAQRGVPEHTIKKLGRWESDAFKRYIRIQSFSLQ